MVESRKARIASASSVRPGRRARQDQVSATNRGREATDERQRVERQRVERQARATDNRVRTQDRERRARIVEARSQDRQRIERQERQARFTDNRVRTQDRAERRARANETMRESKIAALASQREQSRERTADRRFQREDRRTDRFASVQQRAIDERFDERRFGERRFDERRLDGRRLDGRRFDESLALETRRQRVWQAYARRSERFDDDRRERRRNFVRVGQRVSPDWYYNDWYGDYASRRYRTGYYGTPNYYYGYDYDDGYLYRVRRNDNLVTALFPLLGGAYSVGRPLPFYYQSAYNVPLGYRSLYYDTPDYYYRYGDGAIYQVDSTTLLIQGIVALLTGQSFGIGQTLPLGYDVYNVPYAYRSRYYDTADTLYRYDDGYIYGVNPRTRLIQTTIPAYDGYAVGYPAPVGYAGSYYDVPDYYDDLYYDAPGYDYRYASNGIYQVDPNTRMVAALVTLVTGQHLGVGQRLPLGYDVYNVPYDYRDRYYDNDRAMYRYADGNIYQVDPGTRVIGRVIDIV